MDVVWNALGFGIFGVPVLGVAYWIWYRLSPSSARAGRPAGVVVVVTSLFVAAVCVTIGAIVAALTGLLL